jgi:hypothetical protein
MDRKNRIKLTIEQDKAWIAAFGHYKDKGYSDLRADKYTARDLVQTYPKLKKYRVWV